MSFAGFLESTKTDLQPSAQLSLALKALWHEKKDQWELAHDFAQESAGTEGAWVHAYLHRKEGDGSNAAYWYRRAGQPVAAGSFANEWEAIARFLLSKQESGNADATAP